MSDHQAPKTRTVLLTGAAGKVGRRLRAPLAKLYSKLLVTDIVPVTDLAPNERFIQCDMSDPRAVTAITRDVDYVVHFAGYPREADWETLIPANIVAVTNLWEAALANGVQRIVYASTNHVVGFHPTSRRLGVDAELKCDTRYGVTKAFTETVARFYYDKFGLESLGLRIGRCEDTPTDERMLSTWIHPEDLVQLVTLGLEEPVKSSVLYGISANSKAWCFNPPGGLPYEPIHSSDTYANGIESSTRSGVIFQGGPFAEQDYVGDKNRAAARTNSLNDAAG